MKRISILLLILVAFLMVSRAQTLDNLKRTCVETLEGFLDVRTGEFQAVPVMYADMSNQTVSTYYSYIYVARNKKSGLAHIYENDKLLLRYKYDVRVFRMGSNWHDCVFAVKYFENESNEIGYGMETVYAYGFLQNRCDSIVLISNDGYVSKLNGKYYYSTFSNGSTRGETSQIVWLEKRIYKEDDRALLSTNKIGCRLSEGDAYYCSAPADNGVQHFYYLYRDNYMPYTVLIVDGEPVELFGEYTDDNFGLKFSYNGKHWMAVGDGVLWVDGMMKSVEGYTISDFLIANNGDYVYKATKNGEEKQGEVLVVNGEVIRLNVVIGHFALNAQQKLRFHFLSSGQWYVYDNGQINSVANESNSVLYSDDLIDNLVIDKYSADGMHKLSYVCGKEGVEIDGKLLTVSIPFQVVFDKPHNCFKWNAIETNDNGKTDLVVYRYYL